MLSFIRWLLVLPIVACSYVFAFVFGAALPDILPRLCPLAQMAQGSCQAWWFTPVSSGAHLLTMALASALAVGLAALIAPRAQVLIAWLVLLATLTAFVLGAASHPDEWLAAMVGGALPAIAVTLRRPRPAAQVSAPVSAQVSEPLPGNVNHG